MLSPLVNNNITWSGNENISNGVNFYQSQMCFNISDERNCNINPTTRTVTRDVALYGHLNSTFYNCSQVFKENISAQSGYHTM